MNKTIGQLGLTRREEDQMVAFMKALTEPTGQPFVEDVSLAPGAHAV